MSSLEKNRIQRRSGKSPEKPLKKKKKDFVLLFSGRFCFASRPWVCSEIKMLLRLPNRCSDNPLLTARHLAFPVNAVEMDCALHIRQQEERSVAWRSVAGVYWKSRFNTEYFISGSAGWQTQHLHFFFFLLFTVCIWSRVISWFYEFWGDLKKKKKNHPRSLPWAFIKLLD